VKENEVTGPHRRFRDSDCETCKFCMYSYLWSQNLL